MVADGASANRKFFASHSIEEHKKSDITFKAPNITLLGNFVYFMCEVPHLMKTTRNAWSNSRAKGTRHLEVCTCTIAIARISCYIYARTMVKKSSGHTL